MKQRNGLAAMFARTWERDAARTDTLESVFWLTGAGALSLMFAMGAPISSVGDALTTIGRATGIVAGQMMMVQLILAARIPWVERRIGHDRALLMHGQLGRMGFFAMAAHVITLVLGYGARTQTGWWDQSWSFLLHFGSDMTLSVIGFWLLLAVIGTSLAAVRAAWRYETWHVVHLLTYVSVGFAIPHQFSSGTTFAGWAGTGLATLARWYWIALWAVAVGGFLAWRIGRPLVSFFRYDLRVARVDHHADGTVSVWVRGRGLDRMKALPGQFFEWRFLTAGMWAQAHPFSLSAAPSNEYLRITVKVVGDHTEDIATLQVGTRVMVEGPLGRFRADLRQSPGMVLVGAGSGIAPIVSVLEGLDGSAPIVVMLRARTEDQIPHLDEVREMVRERGATLYLLTGRRGHGWLPEGLAARMSQLAPALAASDVYVCGPEEWAGQILDEARRCGVPEQRLHREEYVW